MNKRSISFAHNYPQTIKSTAKRVRPGLLRRDERGTVVLVHGNTSFRIDTFRYPCMKVSSAKAGGGSYALMGGAEGGDMQELATFGSEKGANVAFEAVMKASAGIGRAGAAITTLKWGGIAFGLFCMTVIAGAIHGTATAAGGIPVASAQARPGAGFDPKEPTLEQIAAGDYKFEPKLTAPQIEAPTLSCAAH